MIKYVHRILFGILSILLISIPGTTVFASSEYQQNEPGVKNDYCLSCHDTPGLRTTMPSGEELYIGVDSEIFNSSAHGQLGYACVQCHTDKKEYPHPEKTFLKKINQGATLPDLTPPLKSHLPHYIRIVVIG